MNFFIAYHHIEVVKFLTSQFSMLNLRQEHARSNTVVDMKVDKNIPCCQYGINLCVSDVF